MITNVEIEPALHRLRTLQPDFDRIVKAPANRLRVSLRISDVLVGDQLQLLEYDPKADSYSGAFVVAEVTYVDDVDQQPGVVALSLRVLRRRYKP